MEPAGGRNHGVPWASNEEHDVPNRNDNQEHGTRETTPHRAQRAPGESGQPRGRGFAGMNPEQQREIASEGGRAAHASGHAHEFTSEEARAAGRKGGEARSQHSRAASQSRTGSAGSTDRDIQDTGSSGHRGGGGRS